MNEEMKEKLRRIASLSKREIGDSEESVKINFTVPILECLGHNRLDFEYKYKDIVIKEDLPRFSKVIIETKNYDKPLDRELQQLERYCGEEHPLLGIIANGNEMRIFSPSWRFRRPFPCTLIYHIKRKELENDNNIQLLENIISKDNLRSGKAKDYVIEREKEIEETEREIEDIKKEAKKEEEEYDSKIEGIDSDIETKEEEIKQLKTERENLEKEVKTKVSEIWDAIGLPLEFFRIPTPPSGITTGITSPEFIRKARRVTLQELVDAGLIKDGQTLFLFYNQRISDEQVQIVVPSNKVKYKKDGKLYTTSNLTLSLLKKYKLIGSDRTAIRGPLHWQTEDGRILNDLNEQVRRKRGY